MDYGSLLWSNTRNRRRAVREIVDDDLSLSFSGSAILPVLNAEGQKTQMTIDQTKAVRTGTILKEASEALAAKDPPAFADVLIELIQAEPQRWTSLLFLAGVLPEPGSRQFADRFKPLLLGLNAAMDRIDSQTLDEALRLLHSLTTVEAVIQAIRKVLGSLGIWDRPNQETMYRLASFLEDQQHLIESRQLSGAAAGSFFDPSTLMAASLHDRNSANLASPVGVFESICESLQLVHAYLVHEKGGLNGPIENPPSPYEDSEIQKLLILAAEWRSIKDFVGMDSVSRLARKCDAERCRDVLPAGS